MKTLQDLRYKGKPYAGANTQVDALQALCFCKFIAVGERLDGRKCDVHGTRKYPCGTHNCGCSDYRPNKIKISPTHWPLCVCGHIAQEHN